MKFDFYCVGLCRDNGKPSQIAGAGIVLVSEDDTGRKRQREFGFPLGGSNSSLAEIQAVRLAMSSIVPNMRHHPTTIHALGTYASRMLATENHEYLAKPAKNTDEVGELRKWYAFYPKGRVVKGDKAVEGIVRAKELAKAALESQEEYDSQTIG